MTGNADDAYDVSQEVFLKAFRRSTVQGEASFGSWLYRLAANLSVDFIRRQARRRRTAGIFGRRLGRGAPRRDTRFYIQPQAALERRDCSGASRRD
jgi:RNA polymerase sigma-70 factor (ECF subfamily)